MRRRARQCLHEFGCTVQGQRGTWQSTKLTVTQQPIGLPSIDRSILCSACELPPVCLNLWTRQIGVPVSKRADMREARLIEGLVLLEGRRGHPKFHLAAQVLKIGVHCQRQAQPVCEKALCRSFAAKRQEISATALYKR